MAASLSCGGPIVVDVREVAGLARSGARLTTKFKHDYTAKGHANCNSATLPCLGRQVGRPAPILDTTRRQPHPKVLPSLFLSFSSRTTQNARNLPRR